MAFIAIAVTYMPPEINPTNPEVEAILSKPRAELTRLTRAEFTSKTLTQKRLIIILEQIGAMKSCGSQRDLANIIGIGQPSVQDYLAGNIGDPLRMRSDRLKRIAKARGLTEQTLRRFLSGELDEKEDKDSDRQSFLEMAETIPLTVLIESLPIIRERVLKLIQESGGKLADVASYLKDLPPVSSRKAEQHPEVIDIELEPEPEPHSGNLRLLELIDQKQKELGFDDAKFEDYLSFFLNKEIEPGELFDQLRESIDPVPNKLLSGPISKILGTSPEVLYEIRDQDEEDDPPEKENPGKTEGRKKRIKA